MPDLRRATDDGRPDARLRAALDADDGSPARRSEVLAALATARVFLALAAQALATEESAVPGLRQESTAELSLLSLRAASGARALPVFVDGHEVQRWRREARPVPVDGPQACRTVLDDGADALLLDPTGAAVAVHRAELAELAAGRVPVVGAGLSSRLGVAAAPGAAGDRSPAPPADPALVAALGPALSPERAVRAARLLDGPVLGLVPRVPLAAEELVALVARVRERLGADLPRDGLDVAVVPPHGPGTAVPLRGRLGLRR